MRVYCKKGPYTGFLVLIQIQGSLGESNSVTSLCLYEGYNNSCKTLSKIRAFGSMRGKESQGNS